MKTCPVCRSLCFDDMPVCYGCMHNFDRDGSCMGGNSDSAASSGRLTGDVAPGKDAVAPGDGKKDGIAMEEGKPSAPEGEGRATGAPGAGARGGEWPAEGGELDDDGVGRAEMRCVQGCSCDDAGRRATLRIPMVTSVASGPILSGSTGELSGEVCACSVESSVSAPSLTIEAPEGYRMVLRLERA